MEEAPKHFSDAIPGGYTDHLPRSGTSQACADKAVQRDEADELPRILYWEESDLPRWPLHLLHGSSPGISQLVAIGSASGALGACHSLRRGCRVPFRLATYIRTDLLVPGQIVG